MVYLSLLCCQLSILMDLGKYVAQGLMTEEERKRIIAQNAIRQVTGITYNCWCDDCGDEVMCEHDEDSPHQASMCGDCARIN